MKTSGQQIERLEKGQRNLTKDWIDRAALALGVAPADIITELPKASLHLGRPLNILNAPDLGPTIQSEQGSIPLRKIDFRLSMGDGTNLDDYFEEGIYEIDASLLRLISQAPPHRLIVGEGIGDSMTPTIHDSSTVIIDTTQTDLRDDFIYAITSYGSGGIKRLSRIGRDRVLVISDNEIVPNKEVLMEDLRILGRVVWSGRRH